MQSARDAEATKPAAVRFLGHPGGPPAAPPSTTHGAVGGSDLGATAPGPTVATVAASQGQVWLEFTLEEGRNRQIRRLCARSGLEARLLYRMSLLTPEAFTFSLSLSLAHF